MGDWSFHRHFVLWSKGHYRSLGEEPVEAMRVIMARVSGTELRYVTRADAIAFIVDCALTHGHIDRRQLTYALVQDARLGFTRGTEDVIRVLDASTRFRYVSELPPLGDTDLLTTTKLYNT